MTEMALSGEEGVGTGAQLRHRPQVSVLKSPNFKTNTVVLQHSGLDPDFWMNISPICSLHGHVSCFFRLAYQPKPSKHKNWKELELFKTFKNVFQNNNEKLELLNSFQKLIFDQQSGARGLRPLGPPLATPLDNP